MAIIEVDTTGAATHALVQEAAQVNQFTYLVSGASETVALGSTGIKGGQTLRVRARASEKLGVAETYAIALQYVADDGTITTISTINLTNANTLPGPNNLPNVELAAPLAGGLALIAAVVYVAGGAPADPTISVTMQIT